MKLADALRINQKAGAAADTTPFRVALCCGFTPMHLGHFFAAHIHSRYPDRAVDFVPMPYGDALACLDHIPDDTDLALIVLEWQDLDPRLGFRQADWRHGIARDVIETVRLRLDQLGEKVPQVEEITPVCLGLPALPLLPLLPSPPHLQDAFRAELEFLVIGARRSLIRLPQVTVLSESRSQDATPQHDLKNDLRFGTPYSVAFQSSLAQRLAESAFPKPPLRGLITDLDNTLWRGVIGEVGAGNVHWNLDGHSYLHAFYQQALRALSQAGVLIAVSSKNDPKIVEHGLSRPDLLVDPKSFFPLEIHWGPKSGSVRRILSTWNIGPECVLFLDDSPSEIAEVKHAFPDIQTRLFPTRDDGAIFSLVSELGTLFSRHQLSEEDTLRATSISGAIRHPHPSADPADPDAFLRLSQAQLTIQTAKRGDPRAFELLNKTNQFNLNGGRITPKDWLNLLRCDRSVILVLSYADKFGSLGKIAVLAGKQMGATIDIHHWVLSCRAFSKRIEYQCLRFLFENLNADSVCLHFKETTRNRPVADLIAELSGEAPTGKFILARQTFFDHCPNLFHSIIVGNDT